MNLIKSTLLSAAFLLTATIGFAQVEQKSDTYNYSVTFGADPIPQDQTIPGPTGDIVMHLEIVQLPQGSDNVMEMIAISTFDDIIGQELAQNNEAYFKSNIDATFQSMGGKADSIETVELQGREGRYAVGSLAGGTMKGYLYAYVDGNRGYSLLVVCQVDNADNEAMKNFFKSFKFLK